MAASSSSSSFFFTSTPPALKWKRNDVFISFRGAEIRNTFLSHLYEALLRKNLSVFKDENLDRGKEISPSLLQIIEESCISVVIFSEKYAFSPWCLDELVKMLECKEKMEQIIIPVFYQVDPSHVQDLTGSFKAALDKHRDELKYCVDNVENWSHALTTISKISGWDSQNIKPESELIKGIVDDICEKLRNISSNDCRYNGLVGIDSQVNKVESLLNIGSEDHVHVVGICGMGGIGKTTIAKMIFDRIGYQFDEKFFIPNFKGEREELVPSYLRDGFPYISMGSLYTQHSSIRGRFWNKKVLIVLDNVDSSRHAKIFLGDCSLNNTGSRVIVTSRDRQVLKNVCTKGCIYEVEELNYGESLNLFCLHAFKQNYPSEGYMELSQKAINYAKGIPLALIVLGSNLYGKGTEIWESELAKLEGIPDKEIQGVLKISYDGLDEHEKEIFLDVACFFEGMNEEFVENVLNGCGFEAKTGIRNLCDKSLITMLNYEMLGVPDWMQHMGKVLKMHNLIQQMGRNVVCRECIKNPEKRTRLWNTHDICRVLTKNKPLANLKFLVLTDSVKLMRIPNLSKASNLEVLDLGGCTNLVGISSSLQHLSNLTELRLDMCKGLQNSPSCIHMERLEFLCLERCSEITEFPKIPSSIKHLCLRETAIREVPSTIRHCSQLLVLILKSCRSLKSLPRSIGELKFLEKLNLSGCLELASLPDSIGLLKCLKELNLKECLKLESLPSSIGGLECLEKFNLSKCSKLESLPSGIGGLKCLTNIKLKGCLNLASLPSNIGQLNSLRYLKLNGCSKLESLPDSICNLESFISIKVKDCVNLNELPEMLWKLGRLTELNAAGSGIRKLPLFIRGLDSSDCVQRKGLILPRLITPPVEGLFQLEFVSLKDCGISDFPNCLVRCKHLKALDLGGNNFESIPSEIKQLRYLYKLDVTDCKKLQCLLVVPSLLDLKARNCTSLNSVSKIFTEGNSCSVVVDLDNCKNLDQKACSKIMDDVILQFLCIVQDIRLMKHAIHAGELWSHWLSDSVIFDKETHAIRCLISSTLKTSPSFNAQEQDLRAIKFRQTSLVIPRSEVPQWMKYNNSGSSLSFRFKPSCYSTDFAGFVFCAVVASNVYPYCDIKRIGCTAQFIANSGSSRNIHLNFDFDNNGNVLQLEHTFLWGRLISSLSDDPFNRAAFHFLAEDPLSELSFQFFAEDDQGIRDCKVIMKCGIHPIFHSDSFDQDNEDGEEEGQLIIAPLQKIRKHQELEDDEEQLLHKRSKDT
ncbi:disease resistance protein RPV1 isoform X2 [Hevea brasiliensis]|uniref:disease resistance protein RPV1 isoform X2 n=1 Tax=Hevea brasiliensis TaxID=3981 RepID=UPI0025DE221C|nr:disease resistance protein RPV1 isoform X2 [Hevea brasiliensis]